MKPLLCVIVLLLFTGARLHAQTSSTAVDGYVHSVSYDQSATNHRSFHILTFDNSTGASAMTLAALKSEVVAQLQRANYGSLETDLLNADMVVVVRTGVRADQPHMDDILAGTVDPDVALTTGVHYLQLEAYRLPEYLQFLRQHRSAADDVNLQFQAWRTTVEARGALTRYSQILPALFDVATQYLGLNLPNIRKFRVVSPESTFGNGRQPVATVSLESSG